MNNSLERLIGGVIASLRASVIPNVTDAYARGQAIGVIDVLNNIMPRIEWARSPIIEAVIERRRGLDEARALVPEAPASAETARAINLDCASSAELAAERDRLDGEIADLLVWAHRPGACGDVTGATAVLRRCVHDAIEREMKTTRKPLFAEIARGAGGAAGEASG
jgi:hypothetical protein